MKVDLVVPYIDEREEQAVLDVLRSGWLAHGPKNKEFEKNWAEYFGVKHAISMNSCASTIHVAIDVLGIKGEVIVPSFTFVASVNAIITAGCTPVFIDVEEDTCNLDPSKIEELITPNTEAIMPVHWAGQCANMTEIMSIAQKHGLKVIEDSAETIGGTHNNQKGGTFATGCYSFYPGKNMTTAEGGMFTTDDDEVAERARVLMGHGIAKTTLDRHEENNRPWIRSAVRAGYNFRMSNVHAAIGVVQLSKLDEMNQKRSAHARRYNALLGEISQVTLPIEKIENKHVWQMYTIMVDAKVRDQLVLFLRDNEIGASVHFDPPVHKMPPYKNVKNANNLPVTNRIHNQLVTLPMYPQMAQKQLEFVVGKIKEFFNA
jgi:perosamine synthetase